MAVEIHWNQVGSWKNEMLWFVLNMWKWGCSTIFSDYTEKDPYIKIKEESSTLRTFRVLGKFGKSGSKNQWPDSKSRGLGLCNWLVRINLLFCTLFSHL